MGLRVLFATNSRDRGSTSRTLEAWTRLLPAHDVTPIVTIGGDGPLLSALQAAGTPVYEHPIRYFFEWENPRPFLSAIARLAWRIRQTRADLVHVNEHEHYSVVSRAAYLARVPIVVHLRFKPEAAMCRWLFKRPYTPRRVFFTSQTQMNDSGTNVALAVPTDRFRLIYNGLDFDQFGLDRDARSRLRSAWGLDDNTIALGTASSISPRKRLDDFIRLVVALAASGLAVRGFIAGRPYFDEDDRELAELQNLVATLRAQHLVTFLGYVEPAEPLYHAWDICVGTSTYETFGMTMLEAMACGCPVVGYPGGSVAEVIGDGGLVVPDGDIAELTNAAASLASNADYRAEMSRRARDRARAFDVRRSVGHLVTEYRELLDGAAPKRRGEPIQVIRSTWLTMNPNLGASARALQDWALIGSHNGMAICAVLQHRGDLRNWFRSSGIPYVIDAMPWPDRAKFALSLWHALKLKRWMATNRTEVIHCYEHDLYPFAVALRSVTGLPLVCHCHFAVERQFTQWAFGSAMKKPDAIIWTSHQQQRDCEEAVEGLISPERQYVIPLGLDLTRFGTQRDRREPFRRQLGISPEKIVVASACALRGRKRVDDFLNLVRVLHASNPDVVGMMAGGVVPGDEAYASEVIPRLKSLEATGRFFWLGFLEPVEPFIQAADIFVSTSEYETFGMSVLEAMACGKAVAAYRGGSVYEIVGAAGLVVDTGAEDQLLAAVQSLIDNPARREQLGSAARRRVAEEYNPVKSLAQIKEVYSRVLAESSPVRR